MHLGVCGEGLLVEAANVHVQGGEVRSTEARGSAGEASVHDLICETYSFEHLKRQKRQKKKQEQDQIGVTNITVTAQQMEQEIKEQNNYQYKQKQKQKRRPRKKAIEKCRRMRMGQELFSLVIRQRLNNKPIRAEARQTPNIKKNITGVLKKTQHSCITLNTTAPSQKKRESLLQANNSSYKKQGTGDTSTRGITPVCQVVRPILVFAHHRSPPLCVLFLACRGKCG